MKKGKVIYTTVLLLMFGLPCLANNSNNILKLDMNTQNHAITNLNDIEISNSKTNIDIDSAYNNGKYLTGETNYYKISFFDIKGKRLKTIKKTTDKKFMDTDITSINFSDIPPKTVKYEVTPRRDYTQIQNKAELIRNRLTNITSILTYILANGYYQKGNNGRATYYADYYNLVNKVIEPGLADIGNQYNNGYLINNGTIYISDIQELNNDYCMADPEKPDKRTACGIITIDINGFNPPNTNITQDTINDRFRFLIYPTKVLLYPSDEYDFYSNTINNRLLSEDLNSEIFNEYWNYPKNLKIERTTPSLDVTVNYNNHKNIDQQLEIRFYDANNKQLDSWVWDIPNVEAKYIFHKEIDFSRLNKNIKSYDITLLENKKATKEENNADDIGIIPLEDDNF